MKLSSREKKVKTKQKNKEKRLKCLKLTRTLDLELCLRLDIIFRGGGVNRKKKKEHASFFSYIIHRERRNATRQERSDSYSCTNSTEYSIILHVFFLFLFVAFPSPLAVSYSLPSSTAWVPLLCSLSEGSSVKNSAELK